ncbi:MAG: glycosyltransferase family 9 protein [Desulfovibrio sp.]|nr:glycosyltransferase family 9 protein [Desulfovibrio sp.]
MIPVSTTPAGEPVHGIPDPASVRRVLVCQLRQIGDVLLATPSIELLARHYPGADIHVFTEKKCLPMLENNPHIHRVWPLDKKRLANPVREMAYYHGMRSERFDVVVDFQQLPRCRSVVFWTWARARLSFPPPWYLRPLYTHWQRPEPCYAAAYKAGVLAPLGIRWQGERPRLFLTGEERTAAAALLASLNLRPKEFISLDVTHRHPTRRWPAGYYAQVIDNLADSFPDLGFFLPFGPGEEDDILALRSLCRHAGRVTVPPGLLSLRAMAGCIEQAAMQFGNCSSPRHMAVALGVPTLIILGATSPGWTFPSPEHAHVTAEQFMPMPCRHCNKNTCPNGLACLERLTPDLVLPRLTEHLREYGGIARR